MKNSVYNLSQMLIYERSFSKIYNPPYENRNTKFSLDILLELQKKEIFGDPRLGQTSEHTHSLTKKTEFTRR